MAGLAPTFGRGAMTNHWVDIKNADVVLIMGSNAAENHPCGFKWAIEAKKTRNAKLVSVDPRYTRTSAVSDVYAPLRPGTDIAFLGGVIRYLLEKDRIQHDYVKAYTNASFLLRDDYGFSDGQHATLAYLLSAVIGIAIVAAAIYAIGRLTTALLHRRTPASTPGPSDVNAGEPSRA